jgi:hypothetical protein
MRRSSTNSSTVRRGLEALHKGEAGEHRLATLLHTLGFSVAKGPLPDRFGTDVIGFQWLRHPEWKQIVFYFQAKEYAHSGSVELNPSLAEISIGNPAFLVDTGGSNLFENKFRIATAYQFLLDHPGAAADQSFKVPVRYFRAISSEDEAVAMFVREAARVSGFSPAGTESPLWIVNKHPGCMVTHQELFRLIAGGKLGASEPSAKVIAEVAQRLPTVDEGVLIAAFEQLRRGSPFMQSTASIGVVTEWLKHLNTPMTGGAEDVYHFRNFVSSLRNFAAGTKFTLPQFTWGAVNSWRIF